MNVAQQVRLWFMLGLAILNVIALIGLGTIPNYELAMGGGDGWWGWSLITLVANIAIGSVSLYRFMHPLPPKQAHPYPPAAYFPPQGQHPQYGQPGYPPPPQAQPPSPYTPQQPDTYHHG